jgi:hypothetical protein
MKLRAFAVVAALLALGSVVHAQRSVDAIIREMAQRNAAQDAADRREEEAAQRRAAIQAQPTEDSCRNSAGQRINSRECMDFFKAQRRPSDRECFLSPACRAQIEARNAAAHAKAEERSRLERDAFERAARKERAQAPGGLPRNSGGCGSRGGPGYRKANGKCASWRG